MAPETTLAPENISNQTEVIVILTIFCVVLLMISVFLCFYGYKKLKIRYRNVVENQFGSDDISLEIVVNRGYIFYIF